MKHRGARRRKGSYFGPFASAGAVGRTVNTLQKAFLIRTCSDAVYASRTRPCLRPRAIRASMRSRLQPEMRRSSRFSTVGLRADVTLFARCATLAVGALVQTRPCAAVASLSTNARPAASRPASCSFVTSVWNTPVAVCHSQLARP